MYVFVCINIGVIMESQDNYEKIFKCKVGKSGKSSKVAIILKEDCENNKIEVGDRVVFKLLQVIKNKNKK